jgi:hypothetical protein
MPRCYSCGKFTKKPHREFDGRAERAYCEFCHSEREWKLDGRLEESAGYLNIEAPPLNWWQRVKLFLGIS